MYIASPRNLKLKVGRLKWQRSSYFLFRANHLDLQTPSAHTHLLLYRLQVDWLV